MKDVNRALVAVGSRVLTSPPAFRAPPSIQRFVNDAFARRRGTEASRYVALGRATGDRGSSAIIATGCVPSRMRFGHIIDARINEIPAGAVGAYRRWADQRSGWPVEEDRRPVRSEPRHIAILFKKKKGLPPFFSISGATVTRPYVRALGGAALPPLPGRGRSVP